MKLYGKVNKVVYHNEPKGFYILSMIMDNSDRVPSNYKGKRITVKGNILGVDVKVGTWIPMLGNWVNDPKYGQQFSIHQAPIIENTLSIEDIKGLLTNIGLSSMFVHKLCSNKSDFQILEILGDADLLSKEMKSLNKITATKIVQNWDRKISQFKTLNALSELNLSPAQTNKVWATYGSDTIKVLTDNPWQASIDEVLPFSVCDSIAINFGLNLNNPLRLDSCILQACTKNNYGHLYLKSGDIFAQVQKSFQNLSTSEFAKRLKHLHTTSKLFIDKNVTTFTGGKVTAIYSKQSYIHENESAKLLVERSKIQPSFDDLLEFSKFSPSVSDYIEENLDESEWDDSDIAERQRITYNLASSVVDSWASTAKITLSKLQREGVINGLTSPVSIITGLPGTGKTTSTKALVSIYRQIGILPTLLAPTGIAAKRLESVTGSQAFTIHKALGSKLSIEEEKSQQSSYEGVTKSSEANTIFDEDNTLWDYDESNPHPAKVIIVDESSMLDQALLYKLLTATNKNCKLIFVGDSAQLPSVGPGDVLRSMEKSNFFPTTSLVEIYRQANTSDIILASHDIHNGKVPNLSKLTDFELKLCTSENDILERLIDVAAESYANRFNFQILSPRHKGTVGVTNLNIRIREVINPKMGGINQLKVGETFVREGDRIMVVKNDYELGIFNGDVGKVSRIDHKKQIVRIKIHAYGNAPASLIDIPLSAVGTYLRLAYAVTVHKSQGQEYDYIFMPITDSFSIQLVRNLLYTGVTRAKKKVILYGTQTAFEKAIRNDTRDTRNTLLTKRILSNAIPF